MAGNAVGNGLMSCGCLIMLLPIIGVLIFAAFALHPFAGIALLAFFVLAGFAGVKSAQTG